MMTRLLMTIALLCAVAMPAAAYDARQILNSLRSEAGAGNVRQSPALDRAARMHAVDMATKGYFSHTGSDGSRVGNRAKRAGYRYCRVGENLAYGQKNVRQAFQAWVNSPSHRKNMLRREFVEFGLARAPGDIWVLVLGRRDC